MRFDVPEPPRTGLGLKVLVNPEGAFEESATAPLNPLVGEMAMLRLAEVPAANVSPSVLGVKVKSGGGRTVRSRLVKCDPVVAFPINVTMYVPELAVIPTAIVIVILAVPPADNEAVETFGANDTPAAETCGKIWTGPTNPFRLANDMTVAPEEPA